MARRKTVGKGKSKLSKAQLKAELNALVAHDPMKGKSDDEVVEMIRERFDVMYRMAIGATTGSIRGVILSGAPGVGKSHTVELVMERAGLKNSAFRYTVHKGVITGVNLYKLLWHYKDEGNVIVLDDADGVFFDDDAVSILKAALDSGNRRRISWLSESASLKQENIDTEFDYNGTMIFITNLDFQNKVDEGKSRLAPHMEALISRSIYLDLKIHGRRAIALWVNHLVRRNKMLQDKFQLSPADEEKALAYITKNRDKLRTISIREALKIGQMMKSEPKTWERTADMCLLRNEVN